MKPLCAITVDEAVRLRERQTMGNFLAVGVGGVPWGKTMRGVLAVGADQALQVPVLEESSARSLRTGLMLREFVRTEGGMQPVMLGETGRW